MAATLAATIPDPVRAGLARGWSVVDATTLREDVTLETDVAVVGTGAGGGIAAEILADAGLRVLLIEEGPLRSSSDFRMRESEAYRDLYQESAARKTAEHRFHPPLDIVDGAARIVDPIVSGFNTGVHVWGQFLKDFKSTDW